MTDTSKERIGVYHSLGPGGALRLVRAFLDNVTSRFEYVSIGPKDRPSGWREADERDHEIASRIDDLGVSALLVHPCAVRQAPAVLRYVKVPTLYYMHEPRRRSVEVDYPARSYNAVGIGEVVRRRAAAAREVARRRADRKATLAASALAANSAFTAEAVQRAYGRVPDVVYPGVDVEFFAPENAASTDMDDPYFLVVGGAEWIKRAALIVEAMAIAGTSLRLVATYQRGSSRVLGTLRHLAEAHGVRIEFIENATDLELRQLYRGAEATVCTARLEPFGLTPLESAACGTPVLAVDEGGFRETVVGPVGVRVPPRAAALADAIVDLAGSPRPSPERLHEYVRDHWSVSQHCQRLELVLSTTLGL